ncbi:DUF3226 domain-containing protein [Rhodoblastus sp.]|uniref:DUF3226 domain-containing protein n=1 Tax=Rhodoblastus sp. TaxID=1962975 RepID=UPI0035B4AC61
MVEASRKHLLVEGVDDVYAIAQLMGHHVPWGSHKDSRPVKIVDCGGVEKLLDRTYISTLIKSREVEILGIMIDADEDMHSAWTRVRDICKEQFEDTPDIMPKEGLILKNDKKKLGVWIMPDNASSGMLETFLAYLVPSASQEIWDLATASTQSAMDTGATCKAAHLQKAQIHTWLAWQDPPGQAFGNALVKKTLDPNAESALCFVCWFKELFEL